MQAQKILQPYKYLVRNNVPNPYKKVHTVVMIRHGESLWNLQKKFTGWCDVPLTEQGEADATDAGRLMGERGLEFDVAFTSYLERAWRTCAIALAEANQSSCQVIRSSKLNERHYGALQGHLKDCPKLAAAYGTDKVIEWRRSFHTAPPPLYELDFIRKMGLDSLGTSTELMDPRYVDKLEIERARLTINSGLPYTQPISLGENKKANLYPKTESLKQCQERAFGYWRDVIAPRLLAGERVLIVAHANTIRALVKAVDDIDDDQIAHLKIPNGIPLVYTLNENLKPTQLLSDDLGFQAKYLVSARNHGKMMSYERCVRKKMQSLFEYLDTDNDGRITHENLLRGISSLSASRDDPNSLSLTSQRDFHDSSRDCITNNSELCEFEAEELIRCVPQADATGGVTLQAFLESEATLLPRLTKLRLLQ